MGVGAYLETANKDELGFYQSCGFNTRDEFDLSDGPHIWTMWGLPPDPIEPHYDWKDSRKDSRRVKWRVYRDGSNALK